MAGHNLDGLVFRLFSPTGQLRGGGHFLLLDCEMRCHYTLLLLDEVGA